MENNKNVNNISNSSDASEELEEESFINVNEILKSQLKNIYQIQINYDSFIIKHIGTGSDVPDIIIQEGFGKDNNLSLYNCVYTEDELDKNKIKNTSFLPILKLIEKSTDFNKIYTISIKMNEIPSFNESTNEFNLYLTNMTSNDYFNYVQLEKTINSENIIEKFIESIIEQGFIIL